MQMWKNIVILVLLFLCVQCKVVNPETAKIVVTQNKELQPNDVTFYGRTGKFVVSFVTEQSKGLHPAIYIVGPALIHTVPKIEQQGIQTNLSYTILYTFKSPGRATIVFSWEVKKKYAKAFKVNLQYL